MFGPGDDYQVVPDLTMVEALEECADGLRITGQRECVFVCVSIDVVVSGSQVRGSAFLFVFPLMPWSQDHRSEGVRFCLFPLMPWSQDHRSEGVCFCLCFH